MGFVATAVGGGKKKTASRSKKGCLCQTSLGTGSDKISPGDENLQIWELAEEGKRVMEDPTFEDEPDLKDLK